MGELETNMLEEQLLNTNSSTENEKTNANADNVRENSNKNGLSGLNNNTNNNSSNKNVDALKDLSEQLKTSKEEVNKIEAKQLKLQQDKIEKQNEISKLIEEI